MISFWVSLPASSEEDTPIISAPASASPSAIAFPIPREQPVIRAVLPERLDFLIAYLVCQVIILFFFPLLQYPLYGII